MHALPSVWDRPFLFLAVSISCIVHALIVGISALRGEGAFLRVGRTPAPTTPFKLVYQDDADDARSRWTAHTAQRLTRHIVIPGPSGLASRTLGGGGLDRMADVVSTAGFGGATGGAAGADALMAHGMGASIDLTDVMAAAQGDPVRLAYFLAIREQVQRTADAQDWAASRTPDGGLAYVQFVIDRTGRIHAPAILPGRSQASVPLCNTAVQLVSASNPFPPFPPSFEESRLTVLLPIEFVDPN